MISVDFSGVTPTLGADGSDLRVRVGDGGLPESVAQTLAGKVDGTDPRLPVLIDVSSSAGGGPWIVGTDGRARSADPSTLPTLTTVDVDAPTAGLYAVGTDGRATLLSGPAPTAAPTDVHPTQRAWLAAKARRLTAAPRRTTKGVVAIVADDYPAATLDIFAPLMAARGMPWSW